MSEKLKPPTEAQYAAARVRVAIEFCPPIRPCRECKWPHVDGYCCPHCKSHNP